MFIVVLTVLSSTLANASSEVHSNDALDEYLARSGYPLELISIYTNEQKQYLFENGATYVTHSIDAANLNDVNNDNFNVYSLIDNFWGNLTVSELNSPIQGQKKFSIMYNYFWDEEPNFYFEDKIALAWTDDWDTVTNSYKSSTVAYGAKCEEDPNSYVGYTCDKSFGTTTIEYNNAVYDQLPGSGITFEVELGNIYFKNGKMYDAYAYSGDARIEIVKGHNGSGSYDSSSVAARYFHQTISVTGGTVTYGVPSITITGQHVASPPTYKQWDWSHSD